MGILEEAEGFTYIHTRGATSKIGECSSNLSTPLTYKLVCSTSSKAQAGVGAKIIRIFNA